LRSRSPLHATLYYETGTGTVLVLYRSRRLLTVSFRRPGDGPVVLRLDNHSIPRVERLGFLLLLVASRTGEFRFNVPEGDSFWPVKELARRVDPSLVSDDPADLVITRFLLEHRPVNVILPAGRDYVGTVSRLIRAGLESAGSTSGAGTPSYEELIMRGERRLGSHPFTLRELIKLVLYKHYPILMERVERSSLLYEDLLGLSRYENVFRAVLVLHILNSPGLLGKLLTRLARGRTRSTIRVHVERTDNEFYTLTVEKDGRARKRVQVETPLMGTLVVRALEGRVPESLLRMLRPEHV